MPTLVEHLDLLETAFCDALAHHGDGGGLYLCVLPLDTDHPLDGPVRLQDVYLPHDYLPGSSWHDLVGPATMTSSTGEYVKVLYVLAGASERSRKAGEAFLALAARAGAFCHRLPADEFPPVRGDGAFMSWFIWLYCYVKGTHFTIEADGNSRIVNLFAASLHALRIYHHGDHEGRAPIYQGSLRPGTPGVPTEFSVGQVVYEAAHEAQEPEQEPPATDELTEGSAMDTNPLRKGEEPDAPRSAVAGSAGVANEPPAESAGPDGPFGLRQFLWKGQVREFPRSHGRLHKLLQAVWPEFRGHTPVHIDTLNDRYERAGGGTLGIDTAENYARELCDHLFGWFPGFPAKLCRDGKHHLRWNDVPRDGG